MSTREQRFEAFYKEGLAVAEKINQIANLHAIVDKARGQFNIQIKTPVSAGWYDSVACNMIIDYLKAGKQREAQVVLSQFAYFYIGNPMAKKEAV